LPTRWRHHDVGRAVEILDLADVTAIANPGIGGDQGAQLFLRIGIAHDARIAVVAGDQEMDVLPGNPPRHRNEIIQPLDLANLPDEAHHDIIRRDTELLAQVLTTGKAGNIHRVVDDGRGNTLSIGMARHIVRDGGDSGRPAERRRVVDVDGMEMRDHGNPRQAHRQNLGGTPVVGAVHVHQFHPLAS